jgi:glycosyltransferase involved in cell wall biosynthesis
VCAAKVIALVKYQENGASSRVRFWNLRQGLVENGYSIKMIPLLSNAVLARYYSTKRHSYLSFLGAYLRRIISLKGADSDTIFWVEKEILFGMPFVLEKIFGPTLRRCVIDFDDAVFLGYSDPHLGMFGRADKFVKYAQHAAHITVGSEYILEEMVKNQCMRITKIPSTVFVSTYLRHEHKDVDVVVIGWIGTPITITFMELLRPVFVELSHRCKFELVIIGAYWSCIGVNVKCVPWTKDSEAKSVSSFDIGIMPIDDGPWERGKCGYKLIQYMAAGVVPVGSNIGENNLIVQDGINGFLAATPAEWLRKLEMLCVDPVLRARIGSNARAKALAQYDVSHAVAAVDQVFRDVLRESRTRNA